MRRAVRLRELLVGVQGLALLRNFHDGTDEVAEERLREVRSLLEDEQFAVDYRIAEDGLASGYACWSEQYDQPGNPAIAIEEPAVWPLLEAARPGVALDAACGTGRHTRKLTDLGHAVTGIDISPEMLNRARRAVPECRFIEGDLQSMPFAPGQFDLVVCGLAIGHIADLSATIQELGRVMRTGGRLVVSVLHPFLVLLGWQPSFRDSDRNRRFIREYTHLHSDYIEAFGEARLVADRCVEPRFTEAEVHSNRRAIGFPDAALGAYLDQPAILVWQAIKG